MKIFFGGTYDTTWGDYVKAHIDCKNIVDNSKQITTLHDVSVNDGLKTDCDVHVYCVTPRNRENYYTFADVFDSANLLPDGKTLLCILLDELNDTFSIEEQKSLYMFAYKAKEHGVAVFDNLDLMCVYLNDMYNDELASKTNPDD